MLSMCRILDFLRRWTHFASSRQAAGVRTNKIFLVGFMTSGKSTVAAALGERLGWQVADIDDLIEARERRTIAAIFAQQGEPYFRGVERAVLQEALPLHHAAVATGGGTYADPANRLAIDRNGVAIWLDVSLDTVIDRLPSDGRRPLAADRATMQSLYDARRAAYQLAPLRLAANRVPAGELVEQILDWLGR